jgi:integrase
VKLPKKPKNKPQMRCLDRQQAKRLLTAAKKDRLAALYDLALDAVMRPGELFGPKTESSVRKIILSRRTLVSLKAHRQRMKKEGQDAATGLVFRGTLGGPVRLSNLRRDSFHPTLKRAGLPRIRLYDLRHTMATLLLAAGVNVKVVSERLGHDSFEITLNFYAHALPSMQQGAADTMDQLYGAERQPKTQNAA